MSLLARYFTATRIALPSPPIRAALYSTTSGPWRQPTLVRQYTSSTPSAPPSSGSQDEKPPDPRLSLTFTCTVPDCSHRSTHEFSKASYEKGIVLVQCPNCKNRWEFSLEFFRGSLLIKRSHLIADHLGWFKDHEAMKGGNLRTIEDLMRIKGEKVKRGRVDAGGVVEYVEE